MAGIAELIEKTSSGALSFGNYDFETKQKRSDFEYEGDLYKVKTFKEITKLEKNGLFVYESVPGTVVTEMIAKDRVISFSVEGLEDSSITLELEPQTEYLVSIAGSEIGTMKTNLGGKLVLSVEMDPGCVYEIKVEKK